MPTIKTRIDDKIYRRLVKMRKAEGLPSVSALFLAKCGQLTEEKEASEIVRRALQRAKGKPPGTEFRLRDMFDDAQWAQFSKGARLRAGKMFFRKVGLAVDGVRANRKSASNHQFYEVATAGH